MKGIKVHITLLLLGIFVFPIAYQPYHIVRHHSQKAECHHECCHIKHEEAHDVTFNSYSGEDERCPICDYHFPVNDLPRLLFFTPATPHVLNSVVEIEIKRACKHAISTKIPRAPPLYS
ncbi:hypothetical protein [uncultured Draconibacterium sp.]|uniref:hypothetical protein n=1 Tax=uncultured Draconibacterium sp. TaxID=1573823 RepID=UPI0029C6EFD7|nr:hypothetical protein [uncultured Draconibacterium sp.]